MIVTQLPLALIQDLTKVTLYSLTSNNLKGTGKMFLGFKYMLVCGSLCSPVVWMKAYGDTGLKRGDID